MIVEREMQDEQQDYTLGGRSDKVGYVKRGLRRANRGGGELKKDKEWSAQSERYKGRVAEERGSEVGKK